MTAASKSGEAVAISPVAEEALRFIEAGDAVVPVRFRDKAAHDGWETSAGLAAEEASRALRGQNFGFKVGEWSNGLTDVDLDCPEAAALAPKLLPKTGAMFGRATNRASHYLYVTDLWSSGRQPGDPGKLCVKDVDGKTLVELRIGNGREESEGAHQVVGPGSVHKHSGELVGWEPGCSRAQAAAADGEELLRCFRKLGAATLLARHWPEGGRHDAALPLAGWLARLGWNEAEALAFVEAVAEAAGDEETKDRREAVRSTFRKAKSDRKTTGLPTLTKLLGRELTDKLAEHLAPSDQRPTDRLERMNEQFCVVKDGGRARVLAFEPQDHPGDHERKVATFYSFPEFANFYCNEFVQVGDKPKPLGQWWLRHPRRRSYEGLTFRPDLEPGGTVRERLNLWQGWGVEPAPGDWSRMRAHVEEVLAAGDAEAADYILRWVAWAVQHPAERAEAALVLKGGKGTGKGTLGTATCRMFGQHAHHISSATHLAGRFNAHLRDCCFLFADEAYWPGDKAAEGNLKRLLTEPTLFIEAKFKDGVTVTNMLHVFMATNENWVVPATEHERRYAVFEISEHKRQDQSWFAPLHEQLRSGGYAAMLHDLLRTDLGNWHPRDIPKTEALRDQQRQSLPPLDAWVAGLLEDGVLPGKPGDSRDADANPRVALSHADGRSGLYDRARERSGDKLRFFSDVLLAGHLKKTLGCENWRSAQLRGWVFPPLRECRARWEERFPGWPWPNPEQDDWSAREDPDDEERLPQSERRY